MSVLYQNGLRKVGGAEKEVHEAGRLPLQMPRTQLGKLKRIEREGESESERETERATKGAEATVRTDVLNPLLPG